MKKQEPSSTPQSTALVDSWEKQLRALDEKLRASGHTVKVTEPPSGTTELQATFPPARRPAPSKAGNATRAKAKRVSVGVEWGDELHTVTLSGRVWADIQKGVEHSVVSEGWYEGGRFDIRWGFNGQKLGSLDVSYGEYGADGFIGSWRDAIVSEE